LNILICVHVEKEKKDEENDYTGINSNFNRSSSIVATVPGVASASMDNVVVAEDVYSGVDLSGLELVGVGEGEGGGGGAGGAVGGGGAGAVGGGVGPSIDVAQY